jgi:hypothetical protein
VTFIFGSSGQKRFVQPATFSFLSRPECAKIADILLD